MTYLVAIAAGIAGAAAGWLLAAMAALVLGGMAGMSDFEGGRGMFAVWGAGPLGGIAGLIAGIVLALRYHGKLTGFGTIAGRGVMVIAAIAALVTLGIFRPAIYFAEFSHPLPRVVFEIRLPPNAGLPDKKAVTITLDTDKNQTDALLDGKWATQADGRTVLHGFVDLYMRTTNRLLVLKIAGQPDRLFAIKLWGNPGPTKSFTQWEQVEYIGEGDGLRRADDDDKYEFRFRVDRDTDKATPLHGDATGMGGRK